MKDFAQIISSIGTMIIGVIVAYIAYQQHKTSRDRLRLDLYDKRFAVYESLIRLLTEAINYDGIRIETFQCYITQINTGEFLFTERAVKYLNEVYHKSVILIHIKDDLYHNKIPNGKTKTSLLAEYLEKRKWFEEQIPNSKNVFGDYLRFMTSA